MAMVRRLVELGRAARATSGVRTRQPLGRALVAANGWDRLPDDLRAEVSDELNTGALVSLGTEAGDLVEVSIKANFRALGKRFGKGTPAVAEAVSDADPVGLLAALRATGTAEVTVDGEQVALTDDDVVVTETPRAGWAVASDSGETVALDLTLTPELRRAGLARETVRLVQDARKAAGLAVSDRIELAWAAEGEMAEALREHGSAVGAEVLAMRVFDDEPTNPAAWSAGHGSDLGLRFWLRRT
jgi:isoleucyl-tRNA synthetase